MESWQEIDKQAEPVAGQEGEERPQFRFIAGDRVLWVIITALAVISVLVVYSSTAKMAYMASAGRSTSDFLSQQFLVLGFCFLVMFVVHHINSRFYKIAAKWGFVLSLLLTVGVYFSGHVTNAAARWYNIGGFQFQPSEMLKLFTVLYLARQLAQRQSKINKMRILPSFKVWRWALPEQQKIINEGTKPILMPVFLAALSIVFAHTSSAMMLCVVCFVMMMIGRVKWSELMRLMMLGGVVLALFFLLKVGRSDTAQGRIDTWLSLMFESQTEKPIQDLTDTERSMIAIHNGGLLGEGAGQSVIRAEMTHPESDYAFAFFVEEYGLLLAVILMLLYLWIFFRATEIFRQCGTAFPGLMVLGLALMITCQALLHIMVTVNLSPETGQTLPLISRGGSSVLFTSVALGMILSVSRQNREDSHEKPSGESIYGK